VNTYEIVGVLGFVTNLIGNLMLTGKTRPGWLIRIISNILWGIYAIIIWPSAPSVLLNAVVFSIVNIIGWYRWAPEGDA